MVTADEALVLAYDSKDQAPQWMTPVSSKVLSLMCGRESVFALCEGGELVELTLKSGEKRSSQKVEGTHSVVLTPNGLPALVTEQGVVFEATTLAVPGARHVAFSGDGATALVVDAKGELQLFDARSGAALKSLALDKPATFAVWNPLGKCFLVCADTHVKNVKADLSAHDIFISFKESLVTLAVDDSGRFVGTRAGNVALMVGFPNREMIGSLSYFDKTPGQVAFGPSPWMGVGLNAGDANSVNMTEEGVYRTDPHPGRVRNRWMLSVGVDPSQTAKVLARAGVGAPAASAALVVSAPKAPTAPTAQGGVPMVPVGIALAVLAIIVALLRAA